MDVALVDNKTIVQVWRGHTKKQILAEGFSPTGMGTLHEFEDPDVPICGMTYVKGKLGAPDVTPIVATSLTRSQVLRGLLRRHYITAEEASNDPMVIPAFIMNAFSKYDDNARAEALIQWRSATTFEKSNPLFAMALPALNHGLGREFGAEEVDAFFAEYSVI